MKRIRECERAIVVAFAAAILIVVGMGMPASADDDTVEASNTEASGASSTNGEWNFALAPYIWTTGLSGNVGAFGAPTASIDISAREVISDLDMAFMGVGVVEHGRWGLFTDIVYSKVSTNSTNTPGPLFGGANIEAKTSFVTSMVEYRAIDNGWAELYPMAGARVWYSKTTLNLSGGLLNGRSFSDDATWIDPTIGLRGRISLGEDLSLTGWGIIGGFDVDHDQFMWDVMGGVNYEISDWASAVVGYRATGTDYSHSGYVFDITMQGPVIGAVFRF